MSYMVAISMAAARTFKINNSGSHSASTSAKGRAFACMHLTYRGGMLLSALYTARVLR